MEPGTALTLNLLLRGATVGVLVLIAIALWRDHPSHRVAGRLGAAFATGVAAATLAAMPGFATVPDVWHAAIVGLAAGSMFVFWLFTRALLDDDFKPRPWHLAVWAVLATIGALNCLMIVPQHAALGPAFGAFMGLMPVAWAVLAIAQSLASWREDLVEGRRRLRTLIVGATAAYTVAQLLAAGVSGQDLKVVVESAANAAGTAALTLLVAWRMLQVRGDELFALSMAEPGAAPSPVPAPKPDARQVATLERLMTVEHIYRAPSLTIAALAARMGLPEHRLRKLINQGLGQRNFSSFLNAYRIADAKRTLRDPASADVPVLTIAMDVGFQSLGPFNRAFKAGTGMTPSEYRRGASAEKSTDDATGREVAETV
ncbi:MAG: AraC family transcriptional regulator [Burkholderiales bacterium]